MPVEEVPGTLALGQAFWNRDPKAIAAVIFGAVVAGASGGKSFFNGLKRTPGLARFFRSWGRKCFAKGTLIATKDGLTPIEHVKKGDYVWSRDEGTGEVALRAVVHTFVTPNQKLLEVVLEGANGVRDVLRATGEHPFWSRKRGWVPAGDLRLGEEILQRSGGWLRVSSATWEQKRATVYNFEVAGFHTYFVGEQSAWVHNSCLEKLSKAGRVLDPADKGGRLTRAGRSLQKHRSGGRGGSTRFPGVKGPAESWNAAGQHQLDDILTHPGSTTTPLGRGGLQVTAPDGRGARFDANGSFSGFVE